MGMYVRIDNYKKCPICKKTFLVDSEDYVYKSTIKGKRRYYCSYTCFRKKEKEMEAAKLKAAGIMTPAQISEECGCYIGSIGHAIRSGRLPAVKVGHQWQIKREDAEKFMDAYMEHVEKWGKK